VQAWLKGLTGAEFHDFAGSVVVHPPSSIPFLALGAWILTVGWFGFNVMSAQTLDKISGLVAVNSLMAMVDGVLVYGALKRTMGLRLSQEKEYDGADLSIHKISATPDREANR